MSRHHAAPAATLRHELTLAAAAGVGVALMGAIVTRLGADEGTALDRRVRGALMSRASHPTLHRALHHGLRVAGLAGTMGAYVPATALAAAAVARRRGARQALPIGAAVAGAWAAHYVVKKAVCRPRPAYAATVGNHRPSFPSGHTTRATAAAFAIGYAMVRERIAPRSAVLPLAVAVPAAVGLSRAYGDVHWATDVVGGWGLGAAVAAGAALWYERIRRETVR